MSFLHSPATGQIRPTSFTTCGQSDAGERGLIPVLGGSDRHDPLKTDGFVLRDQSWYVNSDIPCDLLFKVGDVSFHLHKYSMISRSCKMGRVIYESATSAADPDAAVAELDDLPGGACAFELAARFCYGMAVDLTASNISGLRCTAEYLEMTEDLEERNLIFKTEDPEEGNLIFKTEAFLSYVVLSSWRSPASSPPSFDMATQEEEKMSVVVKAEEEPTSLAAATSVVAEEQRRQPARRATAPASNLLNDTSIKEMAEQIAKNPSFSEMPRKSNV